MSPISSRNSVPWFASSKRPTFCAIAPVNAPFSWPNSSLSSSPVGMAAQFSLTNVRAFRGLRVVHGAGDEFLARAGRPADQDGGVGRRDGFDRLQHRSQGRALADDVAELVLRADLLLQVRLLLGELVLQRLDLLERQRVLDGDGDLVGDLMQEVQVRRVVGRRLLGREHQCAEPPPRRRQRQPAAALDAVRPHPFQQPRPPAQLRDVRGDQRLLRLPDQSRRVVVRTQDDLERRFDGFAELRGRADASCWSPHHGAPTRAHRIAPPGRAAPPTRGTARASRDAKRSRPTRRTMPGIAREWS